MLGVLSIFADGYSEFANCLSRNVCRIQDLTGNKPDCIGLFRTINFENAVKVAATTSIADKNVPNNAIFVNALCRCCIPRLEVKRVKVISIVIENDCLGRAFLTRSS